MSSLAGQMIDRSRRQQHRRPVETTRPASPETHRRRGAQRDAEDMLEHRPVAVPPDPGARVIADHQGLDEFVRLQAGEPRRLREVAIASRGSPRRVRNWHRRSHSASRRRRSAACLAIHGTGRARVLGSVHPRDQRALLGSRDDGAGLGQSGKAWLTKQIGLGSDQGHSSGSWCRLHPMWAAIGDDPPNTRLLRRRCGGGVARPDGAHLYSAAALCRSVTSRRTPTRSALPDPRTGNLSTTITSAGASKSGAPLLLA